MNTTTETTPESGKSAATEKPRPTVAELQAILDSNEERKIVVQPDGSIRAEPLNGDGSNDPLHTPLTPTLNAETTEAPPFETQVAEPLPTTTQSEPVAAIPPTPPVVQQDAPPAVNGTARWFKKVSVQMPLYVDKVRIRFEVIGDNIGVIKLDPHSDARTIEVLNECAKAKRGGVVSIDEETFTALKKNHPFKTSAPRFQPQKLRVWDSKPKRVSPSVSGNVAAASRNVRPSPVVGGSGGSAVTAVGDVAVAGKSPATFSPNLQRKSGVLKTPASGQFRADANIPPPFPPPKK